MADTLEPGEQYYEAVITGLDRTFNAPWPEQQDATVGNPIEFWLAVFPTANETDPD